MPPIDLNVPYHEKDDAKRLGARWDAARKTWFLPDGTNTEPFGKWLTSQSDINIRCSSYFIAQSTRICWLVLKNFAGLPADQLLERMIELSLYAEEKLKSG
jgi:hypothetical protein